MYQDDFMIVEGLYITNTVKAVLISSNKDPENKLWIPRSVCNFDDEYIIYPGTENETCSLSRDDDIELQVASWWAKKEGVI